MQKIFRGEGGLNHLIKSVTSDGKGTVFLVTGSHFPRDNDPDFLAGVKYSHYIKSGASLKEDEVENAWHAYKSNNASVVLAIGGGSVIDLAKMIVWKCIQQGIEVPFLAAAPTTTGSGSEATQFAVLYENGKKRSISHPQLLPAAVALDPVLVYSLSHYQAAVSGMDALAQAVESYWSRKVTEGSKKLSCGVISLWKDHFIASLDPHRKEARERMQWAAYLAGQAINITRTTGPHALSYYLTVEYNIPHGQAVALFLPVFFLYNHPSAELYGQFDVDSNEDAMRFIQDRMRQAGLAIDLVSLGIDKEKIIDALLAEVNKERFDNNPVDLDMSLLKKIILDKL